MSPEPSPIDTLGSLERRSSAYGEIRRAIAEKIAGNDEIFLSTGIKVAVGDGAEAAYTANGPVITELVDVDGKAREWTYVFDDNGDLRQRFADGSLSHVVLGGQAEELLTFIQAGDPTDEDGYEEAIRTV